MESLDLPLLWACIIAFGVIMYVVLDGFDLGLGILFPFAKGDRERDLMMNSVAPVWDGNETWLVLGGAALFGAFPMAYAVLLSAFYLPLMIMLVALIFRGVAFEFRFKSRRNRHWWDIAFAGGSTVAAFTQGLVLGTFIQGVPVAGREFAGGSFDWLTPFAVFAGFAVVAGYAMLGASWLLMKSEGELQAWARRAVRILGQATLLAILGVSLWTPFLDTDIAQRWFSWPNILYLSPVPILVGLLALWLEYALAKGQERAPFFLTLALFLLSYGGLAISLWPHIIPPEITIWEAAAPPASQLFMLVGVGILVPIILVYTGYNYWVFRGKTTGEGYHH